MSGMPLPGINVTKEERNPDRLPDSSDLSGPCPRCNRPSNFILLAQFDVTYTGGTNYFPNGQMQKDASEQLTVLHCSYCQQNIVVIEERLVGGIRGGKSGAETWRGIHWWPTPGGNSSFGKEVPRSVADAFGEGVRCLGVRAPNGAVAMFRNALAAIVEHSGSEEAKLQKDLAKKIVQMVADGGFPSSLGDWANHVRSFGNAGAHIESYEPVTIEDAEDISKLTSSLIENIYIIPAQIAARRAIRK